MILFLIDAGSSSATLIESGRGTPPESFFLEGVLWQRVERFVMLMLNSS